MIDQTRAIFILILVSALFGYLVVADVVNRIVENYPKVQCMNVGRAMNDDNIRAQH